MNKPAPFTQNQVDYLHRATNSWFNVAEGGERGGKNVLQTLAFCIMLEVHPNKLHLIAGVSQTTAKLNILDCDGFGLTNFFEGRCREGKYKDRSCLYVKTKTGEKVVLISGGAKGADSLGEQYAKEKGYQVERYLAKWNDLSVPNCRVKYNSYGAYNALAGHNRNQEMLNAVLNIDKLKENTIPPLFLLKLQFDMKKET